MWFRTTYSMVEMAVGTPPVKHLLLFDTGSGTSWVADKKCADGGCANFSGFPRAGYNEEASSTAVNTGQYSEIVYDGGVTGGTIVSDMFGAGGQTWNQTFMAANRSSWTWIPADGFLGLAFSSIAQPGSETVVETMMQGGHLDEPRFGMYFGKELNATGDDGAGSGPGKGVLTIGASREDKYIDGDMTWLPVKKDHLENGDAYQLWRSTLRMFSGSRVGDNGTTIANGTVTYGHRQANGVFDTGAGTIGVPRAAVEDLYRSIGWPGYQAIMDRRHTPLCSEFNSSWAVTFSFSEDGNSYENITITGDMLGGRSGFADRADSCFPPFDDTGNGGLFLFGKVLLKHFYTTYDFGATKVEDYKPRIGFGRLKEEFRPNLGQN
ncbi:hypothetical protein MAPG_08400 [Magnaporthiopsis poae ATCC 64411]|uniref:Peptidase A1 domain-containing protein n=1 Tax=Magnaporthiopsis poae (strain ATCC 64411 / 73-15) TaxID=644358 RepID=A0A0C4E796_MAGP6|nr:hypothetical protein MAPG_08400 [Magnaporthiopsis poae ATCC 64411]